MLSPLTDVLRALMKCAVWTSSSPSALKRRGKVSTSVGGRVNPPTFDRPLSYRPNAPTSATKYLSISPVVLIQFFQIAQSVLEISLKKKGKKKLNKRLDKLIKKKKNLSFAQILFLLKCDKKLRIRSKDESQLTQFRGCEILINFFFLVYKKIFKKSCSNVCYCREKAALLT